MTGASSAPTASSTPIPISTATGRRPARWPYLILADGHLAGFVLINDVSHSGRPLDFAVAEFFVVRKHRRGGIARAARLATRAPARPVGDGGGAGTAAPRPSGAGWRPSWAQGTVEAAFQDDDLWNGLIVRFRADG